MASTEIYKIPQFSNDPPLFRRHSFFEGGGEEGLGILQLFLSIGLQLVYLRKGIVEIIYYFLLLMFIGSNINFSFAIIFEVDVRDSSTLLILG